MAWKPIDFQGIIALEPSLVDHLNLFLEEKEAHLATFILQAVQSPVDESASPVLPNTPSARLKISEAVEILHKKISQLALSRKPIISPNDWILAKEKINRGLWDYTEILEGCIIELFQQAGQVPFAKWRKELLDVIDSIKIIFIHHIEEFLWVFRRLDSLLKEYRWVCQKEAKWLTLKKQFYRWQHLLDGKILDNLEKSRKFLAFRYKKFISRYGEFAKLEAACERSLLKFEGYAILHLLERDSQEKYKQIYRLHKLWTLNRTTKSLPNEEIVKALRNLVSTEHATNIFKDYISALKNELFFRSRLLKVTKEPLTTDKIQKPLMLEVMKGFRSEIHTLGATIANYRDFLLRTDPNPYIRTRWGFAEWIVGPEPTQTKHLMNMGYEVEKIDALFERLQLAVEARGSVASELIKVGQANLDIQRWLHEMGQPLTSRNMMSFYADKVLSQLNALDELGSSNSATVEVVGQVLSKAMRVDWKYHVLFENPLFQEIYEIHQGIVGALDDRQHLIRFNKFKRVIQELEAWVKKKSIQKHIHEIEQDINDLKGYLQDFFAYVQRSFNQENVDKLQASQLMREISQQLLEYRYLFGKFFHELRLNEEEERSLRNQFLFVDQYFESIENRLYDFKKTEGQ